MIAIRSVRGDLDWLFIRAFFSDLLFPRLGVRLGKIRSPAASGGSRALVDY